MKRYESAPPAPVGNWFYEDEPTVTRVTRLVSRERHGRHEAIKALQAGQQMVYAARTPGNIIKIGCTNDIYRRMIQLDGELLAFRFGDFDDEKAIHATLDADLVRGREWFRPSVAVMSVVNDMRADFGLEPVAA